MHANWFRLASCFVLILICVVGCGPSEPSDSVAEFNKTNIQRLRNAYGLYATGNGGAAPKDEASLKEYLKTDKAAEVRLRRMGGSLDEIDSIFISERDNKPFKVRWGISGPKDHAIVFEAEGVNGKRMVAFFEPRELDADEYERHWEGKVKPEF